MSKKEPMVYVKWLDSALAPDWIEAPSDATGVAEIESIGYLIYEDNEHIEIAQNKTVIHKCAVMAIPKPVIKEMKKLKVKK